ncbi:MAG: (2Fe-2S) ferredoxin domain-containing protein [Fibrobacterota bacterium]
MSSSEIIICMGSSCYSRGNGKYHGVIRKYLEESQEEVKVKIRGCRCGGHCMNGPNIWIDGELYSNIDRGSLLDILNHTIGCKKRKKSSAVFKSNIF